MARVNTNITFSLGRHKKDKRPTAYDLPWKQFIQTIEEDAFDGLTPNFTGSENEDDYAMKKGQLGYFAAEFEGNRRNNDNVVGRSLLFIDIDGVRTRDLNYVRACLDEKDLAYYEYPTSGDQHDLKGGARCYRFIIPTARMMKADEIFECQYKFLDWLGLLDMPGIDMTANQRARVMFVPHSLDKARLVDGQPVMVNRLLKHDCEIPDESGSTNWTEESLASASGNAQAIASWAFEEGLTPLSSGRGFAVMCPNWMQHTGDDGTDGSTAIMMPDATHPEARFACQHEHCRELNNHQHFALGLLGIPDNYLPEAHNMSKKQIAALVPDLPAEEVDALYEKEVNAASEESGFATDEDLEDLPEFLFGPQDPIIEGLVNFRSTWYAAGESNIGKSFFILGEMAAVAAGIPFGGRRTMRAHNFYFDAEGGATSEQRKEALRIKYEDPLDWLHIVDLQAEGLDITNKKDLRKITRLIKDVAGDEPVGLVAFDSLNQTVALRGPDRKPFDENNASDMGEVVHALKYICEQTGGSAGVIHHPAKSNNGARTARGSSALHGAVDYAYFIEQPDEERPHQINLYHEKARNGIKQSPRGFILQACKVPVDEKVHSRIENMLSTNPGPQWNLDGETVKPLEVNPRDETLFLVPVALAPFSDSTASPAANDDGEDFTGKGGPKTAAERTMYALLEQLIEEQGDRPEGYNAYKIGYAEKKTSAHYGKTLAKMAERGVLVYGYDPKTGEILKSQYRIPTGINDHDPHELAASDEDLE